MSLLPNNSSRDVVTQAQHWVIKLGSNVLVREGLTVDRPIFTGLIQGISQLLARGHDVTLVSSGAVTLGRHLLGGVPKPQDVPSMQAMAALGQSRLMQLYEREFAFYSIQVAQVLLTRQDLDDRQRYLNARLALDALHRFGVVPIINENDTVATDTLRFGDNDRLAAMTCGLVGADLLVILSDVDGVYDVERKPDGNAQFTTRIPSVLATDPYLDEIAGPPQTGVGTGGMTTKIVAARAAARFGVCTVIAPGKRLGVLGALSRGEDVGTLLSPSEQDGVGGKKVWLHAGARAIGVLHVDEGGGRALVQRGASLLPVGVSDVEGQFEAGAVVDIVAQGRVIARGVCVYSAADARTLMGAQTDEIVERLGFKTLDVLVHRDDMVLV